MDVALYAHLAAVGVRHGPPARWVARSAPRLLDYYATMASAVAAAAEQLRVAGLDAGGPAPGHGGAPANEFDALAGAIDQRCAMQAAAEAGAAAAAAGPTPPPTASPSDQSGRWGFDPALVRAASVDAAVAGRGPLRLLQDIAVTVGIFGTAVVLMRAVARGPGGAGAR